MFIRETSKNVKDKFLVGEEVALDSLQSIIGL
jgi:hypothetical protein